ncbi:hypothetical protein CXG81DRAFT_19834 [Caulochytrium protostelioides]|uniref:Calponin-homology (CH) domain-containing protein n=1 Tax=Caulochytrium protostelioides TaxID=1555241 RepID=A0A4P9X521_9FUNG|nr:hypothetical protein CXG81DRAFT_19834 [Caulochytrium protostelioides]|eukprot:RKP00172.1 hypothetical protein CXG81DRAFT_19834 [Caulochytrium protostelioides]
MRSPTPRKALAEAVPSALGGVPLKSGAPPPAAATMAARGTYADDYTAQARRRDRAVAHHDHLQQWYGLRVAPEALVFHVADTKAARDGPPPSVGSAIAAAGAAAAAAGVGIGVPVVAAAAAAPGAGVGVQRSPLRGPAAGDEHAALAASSSSPPPPAAPASRRTISLPLTVSNYAQKHMVISVLPLSVSYVTVTPAVTEFSLAPGMSKRLTAQLDLSHVESTRYGLCTVIVLETRDGDVFQLPVSLARPPIAVRFAPVIDLGTQHTGFMRMNAHRARHDPAIVSPDRPPTIFTVYNDDPDPVTLTLTAAPTGPSGPMAPMLGSKPGFQASSLASPTARPLPVAAAAAAAGSSPVTPLLLIEPSERIVGGRQQTTFALRWQGTDAVEIDERLSLNVLRHGECVQQHAVACTGRLCESAMVVRTIHPEGPQLVDGALVFPTIYFGDMFKIPWLVRNDGVRPLLWLCGQTSQDVFALDPEGQVLCSMTHITIHPRHGELHPGQADQFIVGFTPPVDDVAWSWPTTLRPPEVYETDLLIECHDDPASELERDAISVQLNSATATRYPRRLVRARARAVPVHVGTDRKDLQFDTIAPGAHQELSFTIRNENTELPIAFRFRTPAPFRLTPAAGEIPPDEACTVRLVFKPAALGDFSTQLHCDFLVVRHPLWNQYLDPVTVVAKRRWNVFAVCRSRRPPRVEASTNAAAVGAGGITLPQLDAADGAAATASGGPSSSRPSQASVSSMVRNEEAASAASPLALRHSRKPPFGSMDLLKQRVKEARHRRYDPENGLLPPEQPVGSSDDGTDMRFSEHLAILTVKKHSPVVQPSMLAVTDKTLTLLRASLSRQQLSAITMNQTVLDFGSVHLNEKRVLVLNWANANPNVHAGIQYIAGAARSLVQVGTPFLALAPLSVAGTEVAIQPSTPGTFEETVVFVINAQYHVRIKAFGTIVQDTIVLANRDLVLKSRGDGASGLQPEETLKITNPSCNPIAFRIVHPQGEAISFWDSANDTFQFDEQKWCHSGRFAIGIPQGHDGYGVIPGKGVLKVRILHAVGLRPVVRQDFQIHLLDAERHVTDQLTFNVEVNVPVRHVLMPQHPDGTINFGSVCIPDKNSEALDDPVIGQLCVMEHVQTITFENPSNLMVIGQLAVAPHAQAHFTLLDTLLQLPGGASTAIRLAMKLPLSCTTVGRFEHTLTMRLWAGKVVRHIKILWDVTNPKFSWQVVPSAAVPAHLAGPGADGARPVSGPAARGGSLSGSAGAGTDTAATKPVLLGPASSLMGPSPVLSSPPSGIVATTSALTETRDITLGSTLRDQLHFVNASTVALSHVLDLREHPDWSVRLVSRAAGTISASSYLQSKRNANNGSSESNLQGIADDGKPYTLTADSDNEAEPASSGGNGNGTGASATANANAITADMNDDPAAVARPESGLYLLKTGPWQSLTLEMAYTPTKPSSWTPTFTCCCVQTGKVSKLALPPIDVWPSPLVMSKQEITFPHLITYSSDTVAHKKESFTITNKSNEAVEWALEIEGQVSGTGVIKKRKQTSRRANEKTVSKSKVLPTFRLEPNQGILGPNDSKTVHVWFHTRDPGLHTIRYVLSMDTCKAPIYLQCIGYCVEPCLVFEPPEIFFPPTWLHGDAVSMTFNIINYGCERNDLQYEIRALSENLVKFDVSFPHNKLLKADGERLPVTISCRPNLVGNSVTRLEVEGYGGRKFYLRMVVVCMAPARWYHIDGDADPGSAANQKVGRDRRRRQRLEISDAINTAPSGWSLNDTTLRNEYLGILKCVTMLVKNNMTLDPAVPLPERLCHHQGRNALNLLQAVSDQKVSGIPTISMIHPPNSRAHALDLWHFYRHLMNQYTLRGIAVHQVMPYALLTRQQAELIQDEFCQHLAFDQGGVVRKEHRQYVRSILHHFMSFSIDAWLTLITLTLNFYLDHVITPTLLGIPECDKLYKTDFVARVRRELPNCGPSETIVRAWVLARLAVCCNGPDERHISLARDLPPQMLFMLRVSYFASWVRDIVWPNPDFYTVMEPAMLTGALDVMFQSLFQMNLDYKFHPSDGGVFRHAATFLIMAAMACQLCGSSNQPVTRFNARLGETCEHRIRIHNPSGKTRRYKAKIGMCLDVVCLNPELELEAKQSGDFVLQMSAKFMKSGFAIFGLESSADGLFGVTYASQIVELRVHSTATPVVLEVPVYGSDTVQIPVTNTFNKAARFVISTTASHVLHFKHGEGSFPSGAAVAATTGDMPADPADSAFGDVQGFHCDQVQLALEPGETQYLNAVFQPVIYGTYYLTVSLVDAKLCEMQFRFTGTTTLPVPADTIALKATAGKSDVKPVTSFGRSWKEVLAQHCARSSQIQHYARNHVRLNARDKSSIKYRLLVISEGDGSIFRVPGTWEFKHNNEMCNSDLLVEFYPKVAGVHRGMLLFDRLDLPELVTFDLEGHAQLSHQVYPLVFRAPMLGITSEEVLLCNTRSEPITWTAELKGAPFTKGLTHKHFTIEPGASFQYVVYFQPKSMKPQKGTLLLKTADEAYLYELTGRVTEPAAAGWVHLELSVTERQTYTFVVRNPHSTELEYAVSTNIPGSEGPATVWVPANGETAYRLEVQADQSGEYRDRVVRFYNEGHGLMSWYACKLTVRPQVLKQLVWRATVDTASRFEVALQNPSPSPVRWDFRLDDRDPRCREITYTPQLTLPSGQRGLCVLQWTPREETRFTCVLTAKGEPEIGFELQIEAVLGNAIALPAATAMVGAHAVVPLPESLRAPVRLVLSDPAHTAVVARARLLPDGDLAHFSSGALYAALHPEAAAAAPAPAGLDGPLGVVVWPSSFSEALAYTLRATAADGALRLYEGTATGTPPSTFPETRLTGPTHTFDFRNPFEDPVRITVAATPLDHAPWAPYLVAASALGRVSAASAAASDAASTAISNALVVGKSVRVADVPAMGVLRLPVQLKAPCMIAGRGAVTVVLNDGPLAWTYPVRVEPAAELPPATVACHVEHTVTLANPLWAAVDVAALRAAVLDGELPETPAGVSAPAPLALRLVPAQAHVHVQVTAIDAVADRPDAIAVRLLLVPASRARIDSSLLVELSLLGALWRLPLVVKPRSARKG